MVEARESNSPFGQDFEIGSTIWGTWIADERSSYNLYHAIECNRSMSSSEGPFQVRYYMAIDNFFSLGELISFQKYLMTR